MLLEQLQAEIEARQRRYALAEAAGAGHWITLHAEDSDEGSVHVFVGGGGSGATTITKGPSSLIGAKLGHLPSKKTHHPAGHEPAGAKDHPHYMEHLPPEKKKGKPYAKLHGAAQTHQEMGPEPLSADQAKAGLATAQAALKGSHAPTASAAPAPTNPTPTAASLAHKASATADLLLKKGYIQQDSHATTIANIQQALQGAQGAEAQGKSTSMAHDVLKGQLKNLAYIHDHPPTATPQPAPSPVASSPVQPAPQSTATSTATHAAALHDQIKQVAKHLHDVGEYPDSAYAAVLSANANWAAQQNIDKLQKSLAYMQKQAAPSQPAPPSPPPPAPSAPKKNTAADYALDATLTVLDKLKDIGEIDEDSFNNIAQHAKTQYGLAKDAEAQGLTTSTFHKSLHNLFQKMSGTLDTITAARQAKKIAAPGPAKAPATASTPSSSAYATALASTHANVTGINEETAARARAFSTEFQKKFHNDDIKAKIAVSKDLGARMEARGVTSTAVKTMKKYFHFGYDMQTPQESFASAMLESWAGSSGDGKITSLAMQRVADQVFDTQTYQDRPVFVEPEDWKKSDAMLADPVFVKTVTAGLQSMYDATQEEFARRGITHITLFRGLKSYSTGTAQKVLDGMDAWTADPGEIALSPISSFATMPATALSFCDGGLGGSGMPPGGHSLIIAGHVPVAQILGGFHAGFGCMSENEFTVLASKNTWKAYSIVGQGPFSHGYHKLQSDVDSK